MRLFMNGMCSALMLCSLILSSIANASEPDNNKLLLQGNVDDIQLKALANDFFKMEQVGSAKISPNGNYVSYKQKTGMKEQLILMNSSTGKKALILEDKYNDNINLYSYYWIDNEAIIVDSYINGKGRMLILCKLTFKDNQVASLDTKFLVENVVLLDPLQKEQNKFLAKKWVDGKAYLFRLDITGKSMSGQFKKSLRLNRKAPENPDWLTNSYGQVVVGFGHNEEDDVNRAWLKRPRSQKWDIFWEGNSDTVFKPVLISGDQKTLHVLSNENSDLICLYKFDIELKAYSEAIYCHNSYDIKSVITDNEKGEVLGVSIIEDGFYQTIYFNKLDRLLDVTLKQELSQTLPYIIDYSLDKRVMLVATMSSSFPGEYHVFRPETSELIKFATKAPWLEKYALGDTQVIRSTSSDGQAIESFLTLPGHHVENPPLIVMPHGGPISVQDTRHFNRHTQFLSALGYAVLQPNYRGSSGYGKAFKNQGMGQWGRLIEDDIESGVKEVIRQGLVDANKVCVYGISYGGYSALISAINRPDTFKCAASYAGVTDLPLLFNDIELVESTAKRSMLEKIVGDPKTDMSELLSFSPVYQAEKVAIPLFLAHGEEDTVVDIEHYFRMKKLLEIHDKPHKIMVFDDEAHGFQYLENMIEFYLELNQFFKSSFSDNSINESVQ